MMNSMMRRIADRLGRAALLCGLVAGCGERAKLPDRKFATPDEAAAAVVAAAEQFNVPELKAILGPDGEALVSSKDTVADRNYATAFAAQAREHLRLEYDSARTSVVLNVGAGDWPMPIPIVEKDGKWHFDASAGGEEILRRRIGQNELDAIAVCRGYVEAQREYARVRHDGALVNQYAQRMVSTPGKQDGLAWQGKDGTWEGPVGQEIAGYIGEGYTERTQPFHGYYFRILKGQGPAAPLGAMNFVVEGAMIGGFALVAAPADYGVTGIQTFMVSWEGTVYQKDFGDKTLEQFKSMELYDPDSTWTPVEGP
jgi:hypothetical protein